jgi:hypothetical protein
MGPLYYPWQRHESQANEGAKFLELTLKSPSFFPLFLEEVFGHPFIGKQ